MGFRLNRNALIGLGLGLLFTMTILILHYWLPMRLGFVEFTINEGSKAVSQGESLLSSVIIIMLFGGAILFISALFGEELAFRGYILPKLEEIHGGFKAVILCSIIFAFWHIPAYFSIYSGGAATHGGKSILVMLLAHGVSVIPICILYMTTRELYGVSLYHALIDVFQYLIIGNPEFGEASKNAIYTMNVKNEVSLDVMGWILQILGILIMLGLCAFAKKFIRSKIRLEG